LDSVADRDLDYRRRPVGLLANPISEAHLDTTLHGSAKLNQRSLEAKRAKKD